MQIVTHMEGHMRVCRNVHVRVCVSLRTDDLMTQDGYLHVSQRPEAILDTQTDQWTIELQCGTFTFRGDPAFQVEWIVSAGLQFCCFVILLC